MVTVMWCSHIDYGQSQISIYASNPMGLNIMWAHVDAT